MTDPETNLPLWLAFLSMHEQATRDWLTGVYNRRYFEETLSDHVAAASRYDRPLSLILFDIDNFKQINDERGHDAGDEALKQFAGVLQSTARKADIVCRYGGDEFAVLLPETGKEQAKMFVERVLSGGSEAPPTAGNEAVAPPIRATAGIAALPCDNLVAHADADLLAKKKR